MVVNGERCKIWNVFHNLLIVMSFEPRDFLPWDTNVFTVYVSFIIVCCMYSTCISFFPFNESEWWPFWQARFSVNSDLNGLFLTQAILYVFWRLGIKCVSHKDYFYYDILSFFWIVTFWSPSTFTIWMKDSEELLLWCFIEERKLYSVNVWWWNCRF